MRGKSENGQEEDHSESSRTSTFGELLRGTLLLAFIVTVVGIALSVVAGALATGASDGEFNLIETLREMMASIFP